MQTANPSVSPLLPIPPEGDGQQTLPGAGLDFTSPHSPLAPYYLRASDVLASVLLGLVFSILSLTPLWHTDIWGHLKFGQGIVSSGQLPASPLSPYENSQSPFRTTYWLSQAGLYLVYDAGALLAGPDALQRMQGGVDFLRALHALFCVLRFLLLWLAFRRLTSPLLALCGLLLVLGFSVGHVAVLRPQVIGELLFAGLLLALSRPVLARRALWLIPVTMVVWANCHGSFVVGLCLLGLSLLGRALEVGGWRCLLAPWRIRADLQLRRLFLVLVLSVGLAALLNPAGPLLFWNTLRMAGHPNVRTMDEWQPLTLRLGAGGHWFYYLSLALVVGTQLLSPRWYSAPQLLLILFFGLQPCLHQRTMIWWLMVVPWVILPHWAAVSARFGLRRDHWQSTPSFRKTLLAGVVPVLAILWLAPVHWLLGGGLTPLPRSLSSATPWKLPAALRAAPPTPDSKSPPRANPFANYPQGKFAGRIFASETLGDYLLWTLGDEYPVLIYSHVHLFSAEHWKDCQLLKWGKEEARAVLDSQGVNLVLVESELHPHLRALLLRSPEWHVVLDETGQTTKRDHRCRLLAAVRRSPVVEPESGKVGEPRKQARK